MFDVISFEKLLQVTAEDLELIRDDLGTVYMDETIEPDVKYVVLAEAFKKIDDWSRYFNRFKEIQDSKLSELNRENARLIGENKLLISKVKELEEKCNKNHGKIGTLKATLEQQNKLIELKNTDSNMIQVDLVEMIEKLDEAVNMIKDNAKALSLSKKLKDEPRVNMHGEQHPRYRNDIDNDSLIDDYKSGMILKDLSTKYNISIPGIRNRLIDLGVYENKYNKNK